MQQLVCLPLLCNTTGESNTGVGTYTLYCNTFGILNTAVGQDALRLNTTGGSNVAIGLDALRTNVTGTSNTAVGVGIAAQCSVNASLVNTIAVGFSNANTANNNTLFGVTQQIALVTVYTKLGKFLLTAETRLTLKLSLITWD